MPKTDPINSDPIEPDLLSQFQILNQRIADMIRLTHEKVEHSSGRGEDEIKSALALPLLSMGQSRKLNP